MAKKKPGTLIIIGGGETKNADTTILEVVAGKVGSGKLVVATMASDDPEEMWDKYRKIFHKLGVQRIEHLNIRYREEALTEDAAAPLNGASVLFFTGGDQLRITSRLGGSKVFRAMEELYAKGGTVAGTSAGASVMSDTMLVSGDGDKSHKLDQVLGMAPGFGLIRNILIDQHFAERGRLGRLLAAVTQNPRQLGVGIDEDTAVVVEAGRKLEVLGNGAVYILDGSDITYSNLTEEEKKDKAISTFDVRLHLLSAGNHFDLQDRRPIVRL
jgi:cyanophycinase